MKAVELDPRMEQAHNELGLLHLGDRRFAQAETALKKAVELNPQYAEAHNNLGVLYGNQGRNQEAERHFQRAVEDDPEYAQAYSNLALTLAGQEKFKEAEVAARQAVALASDSGKALTALGMIQTRLGRMEDAVGTLKKVVDLDPRSAEARLNLGIAMADAHNVDAALDQFTEAVRMAPETPGAPFQSRPSSVPTQQARGSPNRIDKGRLTAAGSHPLAAQFLALTEQQLGNHAAAAAAWRRYIAIRPSDPNGHYELGQMENELGNREQAIGHWKKALEADPNHPEALYNLFRELRKDNPEEARRYQERFQASRTEQRATDRADTLGNFAMASLQAGNVAEAIRQLKEAIEVCRSCRTEFLLHKNLGLIHARSGDLDQAEPRLRMAAKLRPDDAEVSQSLQTIERLRAQKAGTN